MAGPSIRKTFSTPFILGLSLFLMIGSVVGAVYGMRWWVGNHPRAAVANSPANAPVTPPKDTPDAPK